MSQKVWEKSQMSALVEASRLIRVVAGPPTVALDKLLIDRAARALGWSHSRAFDVWYERARCIDAAEMDSLRAAARVTGSAHPAGGELGGDAAIDREFVKRLEARLDDLSAQLRRIDQRMAREAAGPPGV
jgi:hypothetical protein